MTSRLAAGTRRWRPSSAGVWLVAAVLAVGAGAGSPAPVAAQGLAGATAAPAPAGQADAVAATATGGATVVLNQRRIVTFRAPLLGDAPAERAAAAQAALDAALDAAVERGGPSQVGHVRVGELLRFELDGRPVFYLSADDVAGPHAADLLTAAGQKVEGRLRTAVLEARDAADPRQLARAAGYAALATAVAYALLRLLFALRRRVQARLDRQLARWQAAHLAGAANGAATAAAAAATAAKPAGQTGKLLLSTYAQHAQSGAQIAATAVSWVLVVLVVDLWATFVLRQFAYTRPWGERSTAWLLDLLQGFALAIAGAVPGLLTAVLIFVLARLASRANTLFMDRVERGELHLGWLDLDTAGPTRRLGNAVIWLFALAMAYPYLPGAGSEAFKGVSVLAGLMLSLGASGVVGQAMAGFSLMYARSLRVGEYVKIGDTEGTVTGLGLFATKVHTGIGEEVSLPNAVVFSQPVRNFSRLVANGRFVLHTVVTIGYATPWRQVHAMLIEAARRTPGVATEPAPYVVQTALSDFYVEYRLCAQGNNEAPRRRAEAMNQLHGHIQDVFNEQGVQIMSPHYRSDPPEPQVVPHGEWFPAGDRAQPLRPPAATESRP